MSYRSYSREHNSSYDTINTFLSNENINFLINKLSYMNPSKLTKMIRKWYFTNIVDDMIDNVPNLEDLNNKFINYCDGIIGTVKSPSYNWEEKLLLAQSGIWQDKPTTRPPPPFLPLTMSSNRDIRNNPAYTTRIFDQFDSQSTQRTNNLYDVHFQKKPLSSAKLKVPANYGELTPYDIFKLNQNNY